MDVEYWGPQIDSYLSVVEQQLKPLSHEEKVQVLDEIRSRIEEVRFVRACSYGDALLFLGNPKTLSKQYLSRELTKTTGVSLRSLRIRASLFGKANISDIVFQTILMLLSVTTIVLGVIITVQALMNTGTYLVSGESPFNIVRIGSFEMHPLLVLPVSLILSGALIIAGTALWKTRRKRGKIDGSSIGQSYEEEQSLNPQAF